MIYKLKLIFSHPLALAQAPAFARFEMSVFHAALGLSFLLDPYKVIFACILALILLFARGLKKTPYTEQHIAFLKQRIALLFAGIVAFLVIYAQGHATYQMWFIASKIGMAICLYDAYLAFNGITGVFFINTKKLKK